MNSVAISKSFKFVHSVSSKSNAGLTFVLKQVGRTDLTNVLVSVFKISSTGSYVGGSIGRDTVFLCFSQPPFLDYFDVQDLKILLGIISFEIIVASSQHYGSKCIFLPDA